MIQLNPSLLVIASETVIAVLITLVLLSEAALGLPKWHRLLMSTGVVALFVHAVVVISTLGGYNFVLSAWAGHAKDLTIGALALAPILMSLVGGQKPSARISRTSPPSGQRPAA